MYAKKKFNKNTVMLKIFNILIFSKMIDTGIGNHIITGSISITLLSSNQISFIHYLNLIYSRSLISMNDRFNVTFMIAEIQKY